MFKIINAETADKLEDVSNKLFDEVLADGFTPDLMIGIATGGQVVVEAMSHNMSINTLGIKKQRKGTIKKQESKLIKLLPHLPRFINNVLRILEVVYREHKYTSNRWANESDLIELSELQMLAIRNAKSILIVDDTIDSGNTMKSVMDTVLAHTRQGTVLKTAVINQTFKKAIVGVDYCLYLRTIIRFPWAHDVKKSNVERA